MKSTRLAILLFSALLLVGTCDGSFLLRGANTKSTQKNRRLLIRYLKAKAERITPAFYEFLMSGATYEDKLNLQVPDSQYRHCTVQGVTTFSIGQLKGLRSVNGVSLEPLGESSPDLWRLKTTFESFSAVVSAQLSAKSCGKVLDFTSYGTVEVDGAQVEATIRIDADTRRPQVVHLVNVEQHRINYESSSNFRQLTRKLPVRVVEEGIDDFLHQLFTDQLQQVIEQELTSETKR